MMSRPLKNIFGFVSAGLVFLGIFLTLMFAQTGRTETSLSEERLERFSSVLQNYVDTERIPGAVALIAQRGQVAYLEAFAFRDREAAAPQRTDDIFRIASQTKAIVSVAIMLLQEDGRLLISDPAGRYIPEFLETTVAVPLEGRDWRPQGYEVVAADRPITIRDLLTHTSGIGYGYGVASDR
jgi:CubicO group peptidase (beta-lactamase class C family)